MQPCGRWISRACFDTATREYFEGEPRRPATSMAKAGPMQPLRPGVCMFISDHTAGPQYDRAAQRDHVLLPQREEQTGRGIWGFGSATHCLGLAPFHVLQTSLVGEPLLTHPTHILHTVCSKDALIGAHFPGDASYSKPIAPCLSRAPTMH